LPGSFITSSVGGPDTTSPDLTTPSPKAWTLLRITRYFTILSLTLYIIGSFNPAIRSTAVPPTAIPTRGFISFPEPDVEQNVQYQASLIREYLPAYLYFVGTEVLPVMSKNIDEIVHNLKGLTDIKPGLFYHGHIDYSVSVSGGINGLIEMNNVVLQYHTLENPLIYLPYWRLELSSIHDQNIDAWLGRINEYNRTISTPSAVSGVQYTPLTQFEAVNIASSWDTYRRQNELPSPGLDMLTNMVYLVDGGKQPRYQEAFKNIYRFHSIAFSPEGYLQLDNRTHLENTFSPFQVAFESIGECSELLPVFEDANAAKLGYILNLDNAYVAHGNASPEMAELSRRLNDAISALPDDNLIKISNTPKDQQIAFFAVGHYIFAVYGSLDSPSIFK